MNRRGRNYSIILYLRSKVDLIMDYAQYASKLVDRSPSISHPLGSEQSHHFAEKHNIYQRISFIIAYSVFILYYCIYTRK